MSSLSENAMARLINVMRAHGAAVNSPDIKIGIVVSPPPTIKVKLNNIVLEAKDCYISEYLLVGYRREAQGTIVSNTQPATCHVTHSHGINNPYTDDVIYTDTLKVGDLVSVMPMAGEQLYIILDKVVKL